MSDTAPTPPADPTPPVITTPVPSLGRIVHYVLPDSSPNAGQHRAAKITSTWGTENPNLEVSLDQTNDLPDSGGIYYPRLRVWSAEHDEETKANGTWHWPEKV